MHKICATFPKYITLQSKQNNDAGYYITTETDFIQPRH